MKAKKLVLLLDAIVVAIITIAMMTGTVIKTTNLEKSVDLMAENTDLSFDLIASPEEARVKAGETVEITLSVKDIKIGEEGLNSVVGYLSYNEDLFDSVKIAAEEDAGWEIEINQIKDHSMYGKFCIFTMKEGVTKDQDVVRIKMKLKKDLKPQTTKVHFTELASSNGEVEVPEEDRVVTIIIYEEGVPVPDPEPEPEPEPAKPVQTVDNKIIVIIAIAILTILLNILTFGKRDRKSKKVLSAILVMVIGLSCAGIISYAAENINVKEVINSLSYKQSWLNSKKYLVTEEDVSRIAPGTKVETVKAKFNKEVNVTKDGKKVKDGTVVGTGMKVSVKNPSKVDAEGDFAYEISVYGDTNGDGKSNQVELTRIIRNVVDEEKWKLTGAKYKSADLTVDNEINRKDVDKSVKYIVYDEMEIPEFDPVDAPTIEVVEGEFNEEDNYYTTDVKVKIAETAKNGVKTQYKVENSKGEIVPYTEISREDGKLESIIELKKDEIYKVSAYTTGELGNRSEIPYLIVNGVFNNLREYTVEYYYKNLENDEADIYVIDNEKTEKQYEEIGKVIDTYKDKVKPGYDLATEKGINGVEGLPLTISKNEKDNVIKVYYKIHHYGIAYNPDGGTWPNDVNPNPTTYTIETPTITVTNPTKRGYTIKGWVNEDDPNDIPNNPKTIPEGTTGDIRIKVEWKAIPYNITYKNIEGSTVAEGEKRDSYTIEDTPLTIYTPRKEGFTFEGWTLTKLDNEVITDGTTTKTMVIGEGEIGNREYTASWEEIIEDEYTIRYTNLEGATVENNKLNPVKYKTSQTPIDIYNLNNREGFVFTGWTLVQIDDVEQDNPGEPSKATKIPLGQSGNLVYQANWKEAVRYTIEGEIIGELSAHGEMDGVPQTVLEGNDTDEITITVDDGFRVGNVTLYNVINGTKEETGIDWQASKKNGYYLIRTIKNVNCDKKVEAEIVAMTEVAMIVAVPEDDEDLAELPSLVDEQPVLNHVYATLEDAIKDAEMINEERDRNGLEGKVEIQILRDIEDVESNEILQGNDVILDLNGKTITGEYNDIAVLTVQGGGSLQITDRSQEDDGAIINTQGLAIKAENGSELTLGINEEDQEPSITTPLIQGKVNAIKIENGGTFNLYDGLIRGETGNAVDSNGEVNDTPHFYIAYNEQDPEDENARIEYLAVPAGIVAMIGDETFVTLEDAFTTADSMNNTNPIEIDLVRDYLVPNEEGNLITIGENRNYILDLNGHSLTALSANTMFTNNGNFTIKDSAAENIDLNKLTTIKHNSNDVCYYIQKGNVLMPKDAFESSDSKDIHSYVEIDLTNSPEDKNSKLVVTGRAYNRTTYVSVDESKDAPTYGTGRSLYSGKQEFNLAGGKVYYLHISSREYPYYSTESNATYIYTDVITGLELDNKPVIKELAYTKGKITSSQGYRSVIQGNENSKLVLRNVDISTSTSARVVDTLGEVDIKDSKICASAGTSSGGDGLAVYCMGNMSLENGCFYGGINNNNASTVDIESKIINTSILNVYPLRSGVSSSSKTLKVNNSEIYGSFTASENLNADGIKACIANIKKGTVKNARFETLNAGYNVPSSSPDYMVGLYNSDNETNKFKLTLEDSTIVSGLTTYDTNILDVTKCRLGYNKRFLMINYGKTIFKSGSSYGGISNYGYFEIKNGTINSIITNYFRDKYHRGENNNPATYTPYSVGKVVITGGKVTKTINNSFDTYTVEGDPLEPEIIIGTKNVGNDTEVSTTTPTIQLTSTDYDTPTAIYSNLGNVKFYDGQIIAPKGKIISGRFTELETGTCLVSDDIEVEVSGSIKTLERVILSRAEPVAQIAKSSGITIPSGISKTEDDTYYKFYNLVDAIACCPNNAANSSSTTIELLKRLYQAGELDIDSNKNITVDLKGKDLFFCDGENGFVVEDGSKLLIKDTEGTAIISNTLTTRVRNGSYSGGVPVNDHKLIVNNGATELGDGIKLKGTTEVSEYEIIENNKNLIINGAIINGDAELADRGNGKITNKGNLTIKGNTIIKHKSSINNIETGKVIFNGGSIGGDGTSITNSDTATIEIKGGEIKAPITSSSTALTCVKITSNVETTVTNTEATSKIEVIGTQDSIPVVNKIETNGTVNSNYANIKDLKLSNNYATINNSTIGAGSEITNNTETATTIDNSNIQGLKLHSNGTTTITTSKVKNLTVNGGTATINNNNSDKIITDSIVANNDAKLTITNSKGSGCYIENNSSNDITLNKVYATTSTNDQGKYEYNTLRVANRGTGNIYINADCIIATARGEWGHPVALSNEGSGNVYIGNDQNALSTETPLILHHSRAVQNSGAGNIYFNNGKIVGKVNDVYSGIVSPRDGYSIVNGTVDENLNYREEVEAKILSKVCIARIAKSEANVSGLTSDKYVTKENDYEFYELQDAIDAAKTNATIYLILDVQITTTMNSLTINSDDQFTLDVNGYTLKSNKDVTFNNSGKLTLTDSSTGTVGSIKSSSNNLITNNTNGTLTLDKIKISSDAITGTEENPVKVIINNGTLNCVNTPIFSISKGNTFAIETSKALTLNNVTFNGVRGGTGGYFHSYQGTPLDIRAVNNIGNEKVTISECNMYNSFVYNSGDGKVEINNSVLNECGIRNYGTEFKVAGSIINAGYTTSDGDGATTVWRFRMENYAGEMIFENSSTKTLVINTPVTHYTIPESNILNNGGNITFKSGKVYAQIVNENGKIEILDGEYSADINNKEEGTFNILGGTFKEQNKHINIVDGEAVFNSGTSNHGKIENNGILTIGKKADAINNSVPTINYDGQTFRNYEGGKFNFYDGTLTVKNIITDEVSEIPDNASMIITPGEECYTYTVSANTPVAKIGSTPYYTLESAIDACANNTETKIDMQESIILPEGHRLTIPANKKVKINLNNKSIYADYAPTESISDATKTMFTIEANASLEITNDNDPTKGYIYSNADFMIDNKGMFKLSGGNMEILDAHKHFRKKFIDISGEGSMEMSGGCITNKSYGYYGADLATCISAITTGHISLSGGTIKNYGNVRVLSVTSPTDNKINIKVSGNFLLNNNIYGMNSICNVVVECSKVNFEMTGGTIDAYVKTTSSVPDPGVKFYNSIINIKGGKLGKYTSCDSSNELTIDEVNTSIPTEIGMLNTQCKTRIYGGTFIDKLTANETYGDHIIDGKLGAIDDKVKIQGGLTVKNGTTIKNMEMTGNTGITTLGNAGNTTTFAEGVDVKVQGNALTVSAGGLVKILEGTKIESLNGIGLTIKGSSDAVAKVTLGVDDASVSTTQPVITGKTKGISQENYSELYWNDGRAVSPEAAYTTISGVSAIIPERFRDFYGVRTITEGTNKVAYVGPNTAVTVEAKIGDQSFNKLAGAGGAVDYIVQSQSHQGEITLNDSVILDSTLVIPTGCNITIDLKGRGIGVSIESPLIEVQSGATLTIKDSTGNGRIQNLSGVVIKNEGTLNVQIDRTKLITSEGGTAVTGNGTTNYND